MDNDNKTKEYFKNSYLLSSDTELKFNRYIDFQEKNNIYFAFLKKIDEIEDDEFYLPLKKMPIFIKDNIAVKGYQNTCSSKILEGYKSSYDADVVRILKENGAKISGKTNLDEFAMGSTTENSAFGPTRNPLNTEYIPGGSSGGSAAAVCANMAPVALGSDTGGSIRQPASLCGIYGFKPTWGAVSRWGLIAFASSLDVIGILSKNIFDLAIVFELIAQRSKNDMTSIDIERTEFFKEIKNIFFDKISIEEKKERIVKKIKDKDFIPRKIGIIKGIERYISCIDTKDIYFSEISRLKKEGNDIIEFEFPVPIDLPLATYYIIAPAEASSNLARYDGIRYGKKIAEKKDISKLDLFESVSNLRVENFGKEVLRRITIGNFVLSSGYQDKYYSKAQNIRNYLIEKFNNLFDQIDFILTPTTPSYLKKIGEKINPIDEYGADIFTVTANILGAPAISIPVGVNSQNKVGIGMHYMTKPGEDFYLLETIFQFYKEDILKYL